MKTRNFPAARKMTLKQRGQSLIILLLAVLVIGLILAGALYEYRKVHDNNIVNTATNNLTAMIGATEKLYQGAPTGYANIALADLISNGVIPANLVDGAAAVDSFGTALTVAAAPAVNGASYIYAAVPTSMCSNFVQNMAGSVAQITVGTTVVQDSTGGGGPATLDVAGLGTACAANPDITFTFGR